MDEPRRLIVNIRGANASGKTTLARRFLSEATVTADLSMEECAGLTVKGTIFNLKELRSSVILIGPYDESKYSGCDKIKSADAIEAAVRNAVAMRVKLAADGPGGHPGNHVLFEGFRVSKSYSRFAALRNELVREQGVTWLWVMLHAPKELIYERAAARRENGKEIDRDELAAVVRQMDKTRSNVREAFPVDVLTLDPSQSPEFLYLRLLSEMAAREIGKTLGAR